MKFSEDDFKSATKCPCDGYKCCVEVATKDGHVGVRDSKQANSPVLEFTDDEWGAFVAGVKAGEFDV